MKQDVPVPLRSVRLAGRVLWRLSALLVHVAVGLSVAVMVFPCVSTQGRDRWIERWSRGLVRLCGVSLRVAQVPAALPGGQGGLWVANHVSWLDVFVLNSLGAATFVAKAEIRQWPALGFLSQRAGTLFIERASRAAVRQAIRGMRERLADGARVALFPEGTTGDGTQLLPFHSNLFAAAVPGVTAIQPVALDYLWMGQRSTVAAFSDEQSFVASVCQILRTPGLSVEVHCLTAFQIDEAAGPKARHATADACAAAIAACLARDTADN